MKDEIVTAILQEMTPVLDQEQLTRLKSVVRVQLCGYDISKKETGLMCADQNGQNYLRVSTASGPDVILHRKECGGY